MAGDENKKQMYYDDEKRMREGKNEKIYIKKNWKTHRYT